MLSDMAQPAAGSDVPQGVAVEVLVAGACFCLSAGLTALVGRAPQHPPTMGLLLGWPLFALVGGVLLDQRPGARSGRVLTALSLVPALDIAWAASRFGGLPSSPQLDRAISELAAVQVVALAVALPWSFRSPRGSQWGAAGLVVTAVAGAAVLVLGEVGLVASQLRVPGWALVTLGCGGVWFLVAQAARSDERTPRRRVAWLLVTLTLAGSVILGVPSLTSVALGHFLIGLVIGVVALAQDGCG